MTNTNEAREKTKRELGKVYGILAANYTGEEGKRLAQIPGWTGKLLELENAVSEAWTAGGDAWNEFEALRGHWRTGLRTIIKG